MEPNINTHDVELREQDRWLPIANVARLMKNTLPPSAKVSKDAKECMQECVSEYISFVTSEASDKCLREKRKTINGEDILYSMHDLGFENYAEVLKIYLAKYREQQALKQERGETKSKKKHLPQETSEDPSSVDTGLDEELVVPTEEPEQEQLYYENADGNEFAYVEQPEKEPTHRENIEEFSKQIDGPDIDTIAAGLTNGGSEGYF